MGQLRLKVVRVSRSVKINGVIKWCFVRASWRLPYTEITHVVDVVKEAGADPVKLEVDEFEIT